MWVRSANEKKNMGGKRNINWEQVKKYLQSYVGEFYNIAAKGATS